MDINKIVIIGISGTGKTTIARILSNILEIPIIHYDKFVREKNRTEVDEKIVEEKLEHAMKQKKWIME
ncbi:MAG: shikimate kinase [bacterium]